MTETITDAPAEGPTPMYDTDHLRRRIASLDAERQSELAEVWGANQWGALEGLFTAEQYQRIESCVAKFEPSAPEVFAGELQTLAEALFALPEHIRIACQEALSVYAGIKDPSRWLLTSTGRLEECRRLIGEATAYAATVAEADVPAVADLPPVDDTADQVASDEYPGVKADAKTVLAWVGDDPNRAARAYAHEQDRSTPRKGVTTKLEALLGEDRLAQVQAALAANTPPPLDLAAGSPAAPRTEAVPAAEAAAASASPPDASGSPTVAPTATGSEPEAAAAPSPIGEVEDRVAQALRQIGKGFLELAEAIA